ncbi:MAG: ChbG/HpnK family deacetylase [Gemmatimonadota bacterium]|nr:ChbG/HpnK family deacetylase [Gemmatimonadota bacterium]
MAALRRVVINADDLGFAPGVNRGIVEAFEAGTLSSASMMVNTPAFRAAAASVRDRVPTLGVGLHLNLLTGSPLSVAPTLCDPRTGMFFSLGKLASRAFSGRVSAEDVRRECDAQLAALRAEGIEAMHLDSHRHTHGLPGVLPAVLASARAAGVRIVRRPLDAMLPGDPVATGKMAVLRASWSVAARDLGEEDRRFLARSPHFRGIALQGAPDVERRLLALLDRLPEGDTEIMLHPGYDDEILAAQDSYRMEREREVRALCSLAIRERLTRGDVRLVRFDQLA